MVSPMAVEILALDMKVMSLYAWQSEQQLLIKYQFVLTLQYLRQHY